MKSNHKLDAEIAKPLNWAYRHRWPGRISSQTYRAVWDSPEFHGMNLEQFKDTLRTGRAQNANNIGPVALKQLRRAFGVRGEYRKKVNE